MKKKKDETKINKKIEKALKDIKPSLQADGGDVELVEITGKGVVKVRLIGACSGCMLSQITLKSGIESYLKQQVPEIKEVIAV